MKTKIVRIGNSRAIRIPEPLIDQAGLGGEVEITVRDGSLVITPVTRSRVGWAASFEEMARQGDDALIDLGSSRATEWDEDEWEW